MADAKKCDRCGRLYEYYEGVPVKQKGNKYKSIVLAGNGNARGFDLCFPCMTDLTQWLSYDGEPDNEQNMEATNE